MKYRFKIGDEIYHVGSKYTWIIEDFYSSTGTYKLRYKHDIIIVNNINNFRFLKSIPNYFK